MVAAQKPSGTDKIGLKIDYVTRELYMALKPLGYSRKGRKLFRLIGVGQDESMAVIYLQGNRHNEGVAGSFWINLGVINRAASSIVSEIPHLRTMSECFDQPDDAACPFRARIAGTLPVRRESWWPKGLRHGSDYQFPIDRNTDLQELSATVIRLVTDYAQPWFEARATAQFVWSYEGQHWYGSRLPMRMAAALTLGLAGEAERLFRLTLSTEGYFDAEKFYEIRSWALAHGLQVADVEFRPKARLKEPRDGLLGFLFDAIEAKWMRHKGRQ